MMRMCILLPLFLLVAGTAAAQNFTASVNKKTVSVGDYFQVSFTINANASNFVPPSFSDFDVYGGPNQSTSMSYMNGVVTQSLSLSYYLAAKKEGRFTIGPAKITVNGRQLQSNPITIEVVKGIPGQNTSGANASGESGDEDPRYNYSTSTSDNDVFVRTYVSKQKCYLGEQLVVTQKIYSLHQMKGFQNYKAPAYTGFWSKEEDRTAQLVQKTENIDGVVYYMVEFNRTILFPERTGTLTIDPIEVDVVASIQSHRRPRTLMEQFFGSGYEDKLFKRRSRKVDITVLPLPEEGKPANYSGAVGSFTFKAELDRDRVKENEAVNLKVTIGGKGNINLISNPSISFPPEFETYDPRVTENVSVSGVVSGSKSYEYLIIPRKRGNYSIKDFNFSYFDPEKKQYITIPSPQLNITVEPGVAGSGTVASVYSPKNEVAQTENDIRYIKRGDLELKEKDTEFFSSAAHYSLLGLCLAIFLGALTLRNHFVKLNSNVAAVRERKAARLARKKLAEAELFKNNNNKEGFYNEIHLALNKYISDKMNIPVAELSRENILQHMTQKKVSGETAGKFIKTLEDCEYARYAPGAVSDNLSEIFNNTVTLITEIEEQARA